MAKVRNKAAFENFMRRNRRCRIRWSMTRHISEEEFLELLETCWSEAERLAHASGYAEAEKRITRLL